MANYINAEKSLPQVLQEMKDELRDFATTRYEMLIAEFKGKVRTWKLSLPLIVTGALLLFAAFMSLTFGLVALVAALIGGTFAWLWGALVITGLYVILGSIFAYMGYREIAAQGMAPMRTLHVLKQDQQWIKSEAKTA